MKKCTYVFAAMLFATASVVFVSCKDEVDKNLESDYNENQKVAEMTPDEQKDYLVEVGKEFAATLNPNDQRAAADLASGLYRKYESWNWDLIGNQMEDELNKLDAQGFFRMPARIAAMATGETATLDAKEFFVSFVVAGRLFEFDDKTKTVKISTTKDGSIIARFKDENGTDCELKVWGEGKTSTMSYTYEDYHWENVYDEYGNWIDSKYMMVRVPFARRCLPRFICI